MSAKFERAILVCLFSIIIWICLSDDAEGKGGSRGGGRYSGGYSGYRYYGLYYGFIALVIFSICCGCCGCVGICMKIAMMKDKADEAKAAAELNRVDNEERLYISFQWKYISGFLINGFLLP